MEKLLITNMVGVRSEYPSLLIIEPGILHVEKRYDIPYHNSNRIISNTREFIKSNNLTTTKDFDELEMLFKLQVLI